MTDNRQDAKIEIGEDETLDEIRGVKIIQKRKGYRFSEDSLILADFPDLTGVKTAADLGTGSGIIAILLAMRSEELKVTGIELQETLYDMAVRNVLLSSLSERIEIVLGDVRNLRESFRGGSFDLVISNPPYYQAGKGRIGPNLERTLARHEVAITMRDIIGASEFLLKEGGRAVLVYPAERLDEVIATMKNSGLGPTRIRDVYTKEARIVMLEGKKGYLGDVMEEAPLRL